LKTTSPQVCDNYLQWYKTVCAKHNLIQHAWALWRNVQEGTPLAVKQMMEFETINTLQMKGMNDAEKHCCKLKMGVIDWSPELALARYHIEAWTALLQS